MSDSSRGTRSSAVSTPPSTPVVNPYAKSTPSRQRPVHNPYAANSAGRQQQQRRSAVSNTSLAVSGTVPTRRALFASEPISNSHSGQPRGAQSGNGIATAGVSSRNTSYARDHCVPLNPYAKKTDTTTSTGSPRTNLPAVSQRTIPKPSGPTLKRAVTIDQPQNSLSGGTRTTPKPASASEKEIDAEGISASQICGQVDTEALSQLESMGIAEDVARDALLRHDNKVERAATFCFRVMSQQLKEDTEEDGHYISDTEMGDEQKPSSHVQAVPNTTPAGARHGPQIKGSSSAASTSRTTTAAPAPVRSIHTSAKRTLNFSQNGASGKKISAYCSRRQPVFNSAQVLTSNVDRDERNASSPLTPATNADEGSTNASSSPQQSSAVPPQPNVILIDPNKTYVLFFDGGARGNPGMAGAGMVLYAAGDESNEVWSGRQYLGESRTNNEAEYSSLLTGLRCARYLGVERLLAKGDSKLVVNQLRGEYRCSAPNLKPLYESSLMTIQQFTYFDVSHVLRKNNGRSDALANEAMDTKTTDLGDADVLMTPPLSQEDKPALEGGRIQEEPSEANDVIDLMEANSEKEAATNQSIDEEEICIAMSSQSIMGESSSCYEVQPHDEEHWAADLPFIVQFELIRLNLRNALLTSDFGASLKTVAKAHRGQLMLTHELVSIIYEEKVGHSAPYENILKAACLNGVNTDDCNACFISFHAMLTKQGIRLLPPEPVGISTRRIHRRFGSHRFLEIRCDQNCSLVDISKHLRKRVSLGGRQYGLLYSKPSDKKQVYRLFAESGKGIACNDEITAPQAAALMIPPELNPISLATYMKRLKLAFTVTTPTLVLQLGMLELIPDIESTSGAIMTDGCGLLSRDALDLIYSHYIHYREQRVSFLGDCKLVLFILIRCEYSSFQGRIGGLKGMWIVDNSLGPGVKVQYRPSQLKYHVPTTSDEFHHTVEVKEWDIPPTPAHLSRDTVQLLEERGVPKEFFCSLARKEIEELQALRSDRKLLLKRYKARTYLRDSSSLFDDDILWRMLTAGVPLDEPVMQRKVTEFINKELTTFREKSKFLVERSRHLRLFPDHTGLLEHEEAFVTLGDQGAQYDLERYSELVTMRLPSYFKGDLRKLKIVSKAELLQRCPVQGRFFDGVTVGLVLSTKGDKSQADMMSGGDFDGDRAWTCWDNDIVSNVCCYPAPDTRTASFQQPSDPYEQRNMEWSEPRWSELIISYTWHHREDKKWLAKLCTALSVLRDHPNYGFGQTNEVARKAFLQVDSPFAKQWTPDDEKKYGGLTEPHWKSSFKGGYRTYRSRKVLGDLYDLLEEAGTKQELEIEDEMNIYIQRKIEKAIKKNPEEVEGIRKDMEQRLTDFNHAMRDKIQSSERADEVGKRLNNKAISRLYKRHRDEIEGRYDEDDLSKVFAILYEQTYFKSRDRIYRWNGEPYVFAWVVGLDYLTRIIADGKAKHLGSGLALTVERGCEQLIFGRKK